MTDKLGCPICGADRSTLETLATSGASYCDRCGYAHARDETGRVVDLAPTNHERERMEKRSA